MSWLGWVILVIAGGSVLMMYVYLPLRIRKENWISAVPEFIPVDPSDGRIPASTRAFFRDVASQLEPLGFTPMIWVINPEAHKNVTGYLAIFENCGDRASAAAMSIVAEVPGGVKQATHVAEFESSYEDGAALCTNNDSSGSAFPSLPWRRVYKFANMADLGLLYRVHRHLSATPGSSPKEAPPAHGDIVRSIRESIDREYTEHVRTGHLQLGEDGREYRHTVKGTYRAVWSQLWPLKHILRSRCRGAARRVLRELGLPVEYETVDYVAKYKNVDEEIETAELVEE